MGTTAALISLRYAARCGTCAVELPPGTSAGWDRASRTATCVICRAGSPHHPDAPLTSGVAGGSARAKATAERAGNERRRAAEIARRQAEDERTREQHRYLGRLAVALRGVTEPRPTADVAAGSWEKGAVGEEGFGHRLGELASAGYPVLHDRRKPRTSYNIDHLVVAPDGVWIIDMKNYTGRLEHRSTGTLLCPASELYVGGRRRTGLVDNMGWQVDTVRTAVGELLDRHGAGIRPVLCFVGVTMPITQRPFSVGGVMVAWPATVVPAIRNSRGPLTLAAAREIADHLARSLPAGS